MRARFATCGLCRGTFDLAAIPYRCPTDGGNLRVVPPETRPDRAALAASGDPSLWRYGPLLPVSVPPPTTGPLRAAGGTPLVAAPRIAARLGVADAWVKDETREPTGSLKDRASAVVVARALELGIERIVTSSTGNAGVALAAMARAAGLRAAVLVPKTAPRAKLTQLQVFGAELVLVDGSYDDAFRLATEAATSLGWYCRNTAQNPFTTEGKKTVVFEICEALAWDAPDWMVVPVGDGNILVGVHQGLEELHALGWIDRMPRLLGVQAAGSAAIARAFERRESVVEPVRARTLADSIAADAPADGVRALHAARATGGTFAIVEDEAILAAIPALGADAAIFAEPAAAAAYAGALEAARRGLFAAEASVVLLATGSGLKDVDAASRAVGPPPAPIPPRLAALEEALRP